jgi:hypothetical protein
MSALGVPQTKIFLGAYFAFALYFAVFKVNDKFEQGNTTAIDIALPQYFVATFFLSLLVAILANTSVLKWYHVAIYAIALEILGRLIKRKKDGDLGSRIDIIRGFTSGWALVALIVYLRSQST